MLITIYAYSRASILANAIILLEDAFVNDDLELTSNFYFEIIWFRNLSTLYVYRISFHIAEISGKIVFSEYDCWWPVFERILAETLEIVVDIDSST